jgi:hypothetical protein
LFLKDRVTPARTTYVILSEVEGSPFGPPRSFDFAQDDMNLGTTFMDSPGS